jgi:hypothetical protein
MTLPDFSVESQRIAPATVDGWLADARRFRPAPQPAPTAGKFLRGPVPLAWLQTAASLPGKALAVGLALWFLRGVENRLKVRLTREVLHWFSIERKPGYLGLTKLEGAGLVQVSRGRGRCPVVTILCPSPGSTAEGAGG